MGELHVKPTKKQLKEEADRKLREAEELEKKGKGSPQPSPSPSSAVPTPSPSEGAPSASPSPSEAPSFSVSASPSESLPSGSLSASPSPSAAPDDEVEKAKKRAAASAREAQILHARTKKYDEAVIEAEAVQMPTDDEMKTEYGDDWEDMSPGQQRLAKETWVSNKRFEIMSKASKEGKDIQEWMDKVNTFIEDPKTLNKYPVLEGKQEDFKEFAAKPTRRGLDFDDLVLAFKGDLKDNPAKKNKGQMFEKGSPGRKEAPKPNDGKLSIEAAAKLKKTDYKKWKEYLKQGKIRQV